MSKQRLEAFSDGVYAIVITLLILDIRIPEVQSQGLGPALLSMLPQVFTYVLSFFVVGLYWFAHHRVSQNVQRIDGTFIWLNLAWLLFVSVMPFPTSLLGRYPLQGIPTAIYGVDLVLANITGFLITVYLKSHPELCVKPITSATLREQVPVYVTTNGIYAVAIGLGWVAPWVSYCIYALVLAWLMVRYARIDNPFAGSGSVKLHRHFSVSPAKIWQAWTDPGMIRLWFGSDPQGTVLDAQVDLRPGGSFEVTFQNSDASRYTCSGRYVEIETGRRLVFTWTWQDRPGPVELVTVQLAEQGSGTRMAFRHADIDPNTTHNYELGWRSTFDKLERALK